MNQQTNITIRELQEAATKGQYAQALLELQAQNEELQRRLAEQPAQEKEQGGDEKSVKGY